MSGRIERLRRVYHRQICDKVLRQNESGIPNNFALRELVEAVADSDSDSELLDTLMSGRRLRDISDLPFDLAI